MKYLFFDTETTGVPLNYRAPASDYDNWPRMVQLACILASETGEVIEEYNAIIKPDRYAIPLDVVKIHGITTKHAMRDGIEITSVLDKFNELICEVNIPEDPGFLVAHNMHFDRHIVSAEMYRYRPDYVQFIDSAKRICTMNSTTNICRLSSPRGGLKWPKLQELHSYLFGTGFFGAHDAMADIRATAKCFFELKKRGLI